ncbi:hypothetical protein MSA03_09730 [Microbacterium saccharophilum]|uniref:hypothetical protein n=1 Tax=Microbacterium saccharophilum TaxID=1213358 RepID=UPI001193CF62|nr:hypothetical protein [Microbacterium saccharophilum]GEP47465.1 hypothetical protein MSA03_09730 [Microbacterium saccharophilum]
MEVVDGHGSRLARAIAAGFGSAFALLVLSLLFGPSIAHADDDDERPGIIATVTSTLRDAVVEPVIQPVTSGVSEHVVAPLVRPVAEAVQPVVGPAIDAVVKPASETVVHPVVEQVVAPVVAPVAPLVAPLVDAAVTPVVGALDPALTPVTDALAPVLDVVRPAVDAVVVPPLVGDAPTFPPPAHPVTAGSGTTVPPSAPSMDDSSPFAGSLWSAALTSLLVVADHVAAPMAVVADAVAPLASAVLPGGSGFLPVGSSATAGSAGMGPATGALLALVLFAAHHAWTRRHGATDSRVPASPVYPADVSPD